jgi:hypothetical protein
LRPRNSLLGSHPPWERLAADVFPLETGEPTEITFVKVLPEATVTSLTDLLMAAQFEVPPVNEAKVIMLHPVPGERRTRGPPQAEA